MEKTTLVDQKLAAVERLLASRPAEFARQGTVVATWRTVGGGRWGPYYSLRYREGGRQRSVYLGRSAALADAVRRLLERAQRPRRVRLVLERARTEVKASLRRHKQLWQRDLQNVGLTLKGFELRASKYPTYRSR